jgi:hypothetical protein
MKKLIRFGYIAMASLLISSCSKDNSNFLLANDEAAPRLESDIYPVATKPAEMTIGNELSVANPGETLTLFVPYRVVSDDVQTGIITVKDEISGAIVREIAMTASTDLSVLNVAVPEEIQGNSFMFVNIPIENDLVGLSLSVSTKLVGNKLSSENGMKAAFIVQ